MGTALLVIDMQTGFIDGQFAVYGGKRLLERIKGLVERGRAAGLPIIYVQHDSDPEYDGPLHPDLDVRPDDVVIHKLVSDAFADTPLNEVLQARGITHVIVMGLQSELCINATVREAARRGYEVTLVKDAHSTMDGETLTALQIIAHYSETLMEVARVVRAEELVMK